MSKRTGLGPLEVAVLAAAGAAKALPTRGHVKSAKVLDLLYKRDRISPTVGYLVLCELGRPDLYNIRLIDFHGAISTPGFLAMPPRFTEVRLTRAGSAALAAEHGDAGPLPIGLINGTVHLGGKRPPLHPNRTIAALLAVASGAKREEVIDLVGRPYFATGCHVSGELSDFVAGRTTWLRLLPHIDLLGDHRIVVSNLPPDFSGEDAIAHPNAWRRTADLFSAEVAEEIDSRGLPRFVLTLRGDVDGEAALDVLRTHRSLRRGCIVKLKSPLAKVLRRWVDAHDGTDLADRLSGLAEAVADPW